MMRLAIFLVSMFLTAGAVSGYAAEIHGAPRPWQIDFPQAVTQVARDIGWFHNAILVLVTFIVLFVLALVLWSCIAYRASANPTPSRRSHNTALEIVWTAVPALILIAMVFPSLRLLYLQEVPPPAEITIKATGNQWYWTYEYPDEEIEFDALMLNREEVSEAGLSDTLWKLATDLPVVVPVGKNVLVQVTSSDVIHAWAMPNFGSKVDAIPGRLNETWFRSEHEGTYFGQCSELCGRNHAYMPIMLRVVSEREYARWLEMAREEFAVAPNPTPLVASGS